MNKTLLLLGAAAAGYFYIKSQKDKDKDKPDLPATTEPEKPNLATNTIAPKIVNTVKTIIPEKPVIADPKSLKIGDTVYSKKEGLVLYRGTYSGVNRNFTMSAKDTLRFNYGKLIGKVVDTRNGFVVVKYYFDSNKFTYVGAKPADIYKK